MRGPLLVLLALALLAAGCGSDPSSFQGSGDALKDASTSRVEWRMEGKGVPDWALMRGTGSIDYANGRGEVVFKGNSDSGSEARALFIGRDSYLGVEVDGKMHWLKQSVDDATGTHRFAPGGPGTTSPDRLLKELTKSSKKVEKLGTEEIRGVPTTHYRAQLEKTKAMTEPGVVEVWVDGQGLPRRVRIPYGDDEHQGAEVSDLFDFGVAVDVKAPPANEVVSEDEFNKVMEKECAGAEKAPEKMNPLCVLFAIEPSGPSDDDIQIEPTPTATVPTTEGK
jgi:hypothetical protein